MLMLGAKFARRLLPGEGNASFSSVSGITDRSYRSQHGIERQGPGWRLAHPLDGSPATTHRASGNAGRSGGAAVGRDRALRRKIARGLAIWGQRAWTCEMACRR